MDMEEQNEVHFDEFSRKSRLSTRKTRVHSTPPPKSRKTGRGAV